MEWSIKHVKFTDTNYLERIINECIPNILQLENHIREINDTIEYGEEHQSDEMQKRIIYRNKLITDRNRWSRKGKIANLELISRG
jgi:hypothetical protein